MLGMMRNGMWEYSLRRGFTLLEMMIVLSLLAILAAITIPSVVGVIPRGKEQAYKVDRRTIQAAVDGYFSKESTYPTASGSGGDTQSTSYYINMDLLVTNKYLNDVPESASSDNKTAATGYYSWYVDSSGRVRSWPTFTPGRFP